MLNGAAPWNRYGTSCHGPVEYHLNLAFAKTLAYGFEALIIPKLIGFDRTKSANRCVSDCCNLLIFHESTKLNLRAGRIEFNFVGNRLDTAVAEKIWEHLQIKVRYTDGLGQAGIYETLQNTPKNVNWNSIGWIFIKETCRPVDQVAVNLLYLQLGKRGAQSSFRVLEIGWPKFCHYK